MQSGIIPAAEAKTAVQDLLSNITTRFDQIDSLSLQEVNLYIKVIMNRKDNLSKILQCSRRVGKYNMLIPRVQNSEISLTMTGHTYSWEHGIQILADYNKALLLNDQLNDLLSELEEKKLLLEEFSKVREELNRRAEIHQSHRAPTTNSSSETLDEEPESKGLFSEPPKDRDNRTIEEARDIVALQALKALDHQTEKYRELKSQFASLKQRKDEEEKKLQASLAKTEQLQYDALTLQTRNAALLAQLKAQQENKPIISSIQRQDLTDILNIYYPKKIFHSDEKDSTLAKLRKLTAQNKEILSIEEIEDCIKSEPTYIDIFNKPLNYNAPSLTKIGRIVKELGTLFRNPSLAPSFTN